METPEKYPSPVACAILWRLPSLFGDDTHAEVPIQCVYHSTEYAFVWSSASVGCESGPPTRVRNKNADRSERETPRPLMKLK